jgi:methylated-DNA-protein-cysteine methyltransferase-like protein
MDTSFSRRVYDLVAHIPRGRVMTYGQIAGLCGNARASRIVGGLAHFGPPDVPWQRVVNKKGGLASGYPGGREGHKKDLSAEGVAVMGEAGFYTVDVNRLLWNPYE